MGVVGVADDRTRGRRRARFSGSHCGPDERVQKVCIWTPDKDLAQCVVGERVVQVDRRSGQIRDAARSPRQVRCRAGVIPDYLALVGDAADGYPGIGGYGPKTAARLINRYGPLEQFPVEILKDNLERALLFKKLATLRIDAPLFGDVEELRWRGATPAFASLAEKIGTARVAQRVRVLEEGLTDRIG